MLQTTINTGASWFESPVAHFNGSLDEISCCIPEFERRSFAAAQPDGKKTRLNERFDMIVRKPYHDDTDFVPINVVSKNYALVPHKTVLDTAIKALQDSKIPVDGINADLTITQYGERIHLSLYLPDTYNFTPDDGEPMALTLECFNSVDGSSRFRALVGWFRFVCSNGLVIGVKKKELWRRHSGYMSIDAINSVLTAGIKDAQQDKKLYKKWTSNKIDKDKLIAWVEKPLQKAWGFKAAARAYHISQTGCDAEILAAFEKRRPIEAKLKPALPVPGSPPVAKNLYDITQILAWLAKERHDLQEQLQWRQQIPALMEKLAA